MGTNLARLLENYWKRHQIVPKVGKCIGTAFGTGRLGDFGTNDAEVRGRVCEFLVAGHTKTGNAVEVWVLEAGYGRNSTTGSGDTVALYICGKVTGDSGGVGGLTAYF